MSVLIPKSTQKVWGEHAVLNLNYLIEGMVLRGFIGPLTWKHKVVIPFVKNISEKIRIFLTISRFSSDGNYEKFDCSAVVASKTIFENQMELDMWNIGPSDSDKWHKDYVNCMVVRLSHFKWEESFRDTCPFWFMTTGKEISNNIDNFLSDIDNLFMSFFDEIKTDKMLFEMIEKLEHKNASPWVRSEPVLFFSNMKERKVALLKGIS